MDMAKKQNKPDTRILIETLALLVLVILLSLLIPQMKGLFELIPIVYILVEKHLRKRTFNEIGFKLKHTLKDVKANWYLILLVAVILQFGTLIFAKYFIPDFVAHVQSRIPLVTMSQLIPLFVEITVATFIEEIIYRGFFQERLGRYSGTAISVILTSLVFSFMHFSAGTFIVVAYDIFTIFLDSLIYSIIYHRTKNIFASWVAHYLADLIAVVAMLILIK